MNSGAFKRYEVLGPWAEVDPRPVRGITPRLKELAGKKIGLFCNGKRAARPMMMVVDQKLRERFPDSEISHFVFPQNCEIIDTEEAAGLRAWAKQVDAVVSAVGD